MAVIVPVSFPLFSPNIKRIASIQSDSSVVAAGTAVLKVAGSYLYIKFSLNKNFKSKIGYGKAKV